MSSKTYLEAIEDVLNGEMERRSDLIVLRPGARPVLEEDERDVALPRLGASAVSVALGAALYGMHPVLDLRQERNADAILREAVGMLPEDGWGEMTVVANADGKDTVDGLSGMRVFAPANPRQAAGFTRAALRGDGVSLLLADQSLYGMEDDVPDEPDFMLMPLDGEEESEPEAECGGAEEAIEVVLDEADGEEMTETAENAERDDEGAASVAEEDKKQAKARLFCATRSVPCGLERLREMADELEMPAGLLAARCMERVAGQQGGFAWTYDPDALPGECAFIPPEEGAFVWLGCDRLTVSYDAAETAHADAATVLRAVKRMLEKPALLIYDKEADGQ